MKRASFLLLLCTFAVFAAAVALVTIGLRRELRGRFIQQHAAVLQPLAQELTAEALEELSKGGDRYLAADLVRWSLEQMHTQDLILNVQLFDAQGFLLAEDPSAQLSSPLAPADLRRSLAGLAEARYYKNPGWDELFPGDEAKVDLGVPLVEVISPLRTANSPKIVATARFLLNGLNTQRELAAFDRRILTSALSVIAVGLAVLSGVFFITFRRLERSRREIETSRQQLISANHELALAAKSSAIGSISGHLIHGLKNPLASLHSVFSHGGPDRALTGEEAAQCRERIGTMQHMIGDLMGILKDEEQRLVYDYTLEELAELLQSKAQPRAKRRGVELAVREAPQLKLPGRKGNLLLLMLTNLVDNAIDASREGGTVEVSFAASERSLDIDVRDQGGGLPARVRERLFSPTQSAKDTGGGIGLALARQMARNIGADIQLQETGPGGTCFRVVLPEPSSC